MKRYQAVINVPGYLPMSEDDDLFDTPAQAWEYLASERQRDLEDDMNDEADQVDDDQALEEMDGHVSEGICGVVYGHTPGSDSEHDPGLAYSVIETDPVAAGMRWLDKNYPSHAEHVDLNLLDVSDFRHCPLAQAVRCDYGRVVIAHGLDSAESRRLGFLARNSEEEEELTEDWRQAYRERGTTPRNEVK